MLTERQSRASAEIAERTGIAQSLEMGIAVSHGVLLTKGARFRHPDVELPLPESHPA